ncbi:MAG: hypothetical protein A3C50_04105 [Candidatus Staskawiczbacteria bacterium RIFCSPHIGHO2_02_FULL_43_16]|uniref:Uncharacterized protein n=1 Tax=Candidatus Staskawiczbacteria bacterium RIFCSPHIGHO2_01_FULL_41_41 TaxID=1802203 RepID=A0A1G2HRG5_9BACT|nr:MAG: hypothetical protein A2822_00400 [Candidatus Staskawiczbacteria bacterium RIFCSPHIGHO2_01_FULL_41_41]OGZ68113.1 MAG: hypothetical protein A3C50_04105 [Candidatus Staskawiczbacteria bacterium RIFCSPHIGHO2_02_FULL_43_16]OGZ74852.1 MAG: hypothetical protein A3A12_03300 [Candidatus Staskawiczbacteria bacterium RIFCSPLOWO2_01_FULL_43_17b]
MNPEEPKEGQENNPSKFIEALRAIITYADLQDFLEQDGKERNYNGRALVKGIWAAIGFKQRTEQSSLHQLDQTAREQLMAEFRYMDDAEADALIEKIGLLIESEPQRAEDEEERKRIAKRTNDLRVMMAEDKGKSQEEIEELKEELREKMRADWGEEADGPVSQPSVKKSEEKKPWWKIW